MLSQFIYSTDTYWEPVICWAQQMNGRWSLVHGAYVQPAGECSRLCDTFPEEKEETSRGVGRPVRAATSPAGRGQCHHCGIRDPWALRPCTGFQGGLKLLCAQGCRRERAGSAAWVPSGAGLLVAVSTPGGNPQHLGLQPSGAGQSRSSGHFRVLALWVPLLLYIRVCFPSFLS